MSASRRIPPAAHERQTHGVRDEAIRHTPNSADPLQWERDFLENVRHHPTAKMAWREIERAGSGDWARILLFKYANQADEVIAKVRRENDDMASSLESAARAARQASERQNDPRAKLFAERLKRAAETASRTPWAFHNPNVKTLGDAAATYTEIATLPLDKSASAFRKRADALRRYGPKLLLVPLRDYATEFGIRLGLRRLVALASCAAPGRKLDERTLSRFFALKDIKASAPQYLSDFKDALSTPASAVPPSKI